MAYHDFGLVSLPKLGGVELTILVSIVRHDRHCVIYPYKFIVCEINTVGYQEIHRAWRDVQTASHGNVRILLNRFSRFLLSIFR